MLHGTCYLPVLSALQTGPMLPQEWINGPSSFFPFRSGEGGSTVLVNKRQVLSLSVASPSREDERSWDSAALVRHVLVEAGSERFEGEIVIDMPENQRRLVDHLNRPEAFLLVQSGHRQHLIQKDRISRVAEIRET
ncbi:MAG TPA: hypothetical protein VGK32_07500 [Vicinamibacterales bacterium]